MRGAKAEPMWFPYSSAKGAVLGALARFVNARGLRGCAPCVAAERYFPSTHVLGVT